MVADLARFIGATYLHGIHCVYIPSTLVGMATSSVKLEASLNVPGMRNAIGIIHELDRVYLDLDFLETLPERQLRCGFAEIIILAVSYDHTLLEFLETSCEKVKYFYIYHFLLFFSCFYLFFHFFLKNLFMKFCSKSYIHQLLAFTASKSG